MKQLSDTEKQELETKIKDEQERQQTLGEMNPNTPKDSKETSAKTGFTRRPSCLEAFNQLPIISQQVHRRMLESRRLTPNFSKISKRGSVS